MAKPQEVHLKYKDRKNVLHAVSAWSCQHQLVLGQIAVIEKSTRKKTQEERWYISSLLLDAKQASHGVRAHWGVESMHWILDVTFREDESRIRQENGALVFNIMRKIALNLFKQDKKMASLDDNFRSSLL